MNAIRTIGITSAIMLAVLACGCTTRKQMPDKEVHSVPTTAWIGDIFEAARSGNVEKVKTALAAKPELLNARDNAGLAPLHGAAMEGRNEMAALLLAKGAEVNSKDNHGWTPLHWAAALGHEGVVELLLDKGADVNAKDNDGKTPLHWALNTDHPEVAGLLRKHGGKE